MKKLQIDGSADLYKILNFIKNSQEDDLSLEFLSDSNIHKNASNINVIKKYADKNQKTINFETEDAGLSDYLRAVDEGSNSFNNHPISFEDIKEIQKEKAKLNLAVVNPMNIFNKLGRKLSGMKKGSSSVSEVSTSSKAAYIKVGVISAFVILFLIIGVWSFITYVPKAVVTLKIDSDVFIKLIDVKADAKAAEVSTETNTIPAFEVTAEDSDTKTIDTTGLKQIGEKASGEVTITNKKDEKIKIKKGAEFKTKDNDKNLIYVATEDKEIDGAEEVTDTDSNQDGDQPGTVYGSGKIKVEAQTFGTDYNIGKEKEFSIEGFDKDDVTGKNEKEVNGGSSSEVKAVSQNDLDTLKKSIEESIKEKFKTTLRQRLATGQVLSEGSIVITPAKAEYSAQLDDQTDTVSLTARYTATAFAYEEANLDKVISESITKVIPENFVLSTAKPEYDAIPVKSDEEGVLNIQVKLKSSIIPNLDQTKIKSDLAGMTLEEAQNYLGELPNVKETAIELSPNLPGPLLRMPRRPSNIEIKL